MIMTKETNILTRKGFFDRHRELLQDSKNGREAFNKLVDELDEKYNIDPPYSSYESFKRGQTYWHKKRNRKQ